MLHWIRQGALALVILSASFNAFSQDALIKPMGSQSHILSAPQSEAKIISKSAIKVVSFPKFSLSKVAAKHFHNRLTQRSEGRHLLSTTPSTVNIAEKISLEMNGVPVLDQGIHGSCVTFAVSAALDAINTGNDEISQLCSLALGSEIHSTNYPYPSGWEGSMGDIVLKQFKKYGVISIQDQKMNGCGGLNEYPLTSEVVGTAMTPSEYISRSYELMAGMNYKTLISYDDAFSHTVDSDALLNKVKKEIANGHRVVIGIILDPTVGIAGAVGTNHFTNDTWIINLNLLRTMSNDCNEDRCLINAHEIVITGYDDNLKVNGNKGIFKIRNSWGSLYGDHGDFFVSYDYFKLMVMEAYAIQ